MVERAIDIRYQAIADTKRTANYLACSAKNYDVHRSYPPGLQEGYCRYYEGNTHNLKTGVCKVRLAGKYEELIEAGAINLSENHPNPHERYPVAAPLAKIMGLDIKGRLNGLEPEKCYRCPQKLNERKAAKVVTRVSQQLNEALRFQSLSPDGYPLK